MGSFLTSPNITTPTKRRPRDEIDTSEPEFDDDHARRGFTQVANKESIRAIEAVIREETRCGEVTYRVRNVFCLSPTRSLLSHLEMAMCWCELLAAHARRVYGTVTGSRIRAAVQLAEKLSQGALGARFALRDVYHSEWGLLDTKERAAAAC